MRAREGKVEGLVVVHREREVRMGTKMNEKREEIKRIERAEVRQSGRE